MASAAVGAVWVKVALALDLVLTDLAEVVGEARKGRYLTLCHHLHCKLCQGGHIP